MLQRLAIVSVLLLVLGGTQTFAQENPAIVMQNAPDCNDAKNDADLQKAAAFAAGEQMGPQKQLHLMWALEASDKMLVKELTARVFAWAGGALSPKISS